MEFKNLKELIENVKKNKTIDTSNWREFELIKLFPKIGRGTRIVKSKRKAGDMPLVTAGQYNNGISSYIEAPNNFEVFENCVTIDMFGNCFYQEGKFVCDDNVYPLNGIPNKKVGIFLSTVIHNALVDEFSFAKQVRLKQLKNVRIKLPVKDTQPNLPNWDEMENFISQLEKWLNEKTKTNYDEY